MLHLHRAERADGLVAMLAELLSDPLPDPMTAEVVSVPTRGVERWLTQRLSTRLGVTGGREDGVCANVTFPFPGTLVGAAVAGASALDAATDPWLPERSVWPLLELVGDSLDEHWARPLAAHLGGTDRRFGTVRHVADLYDRYSVHRPEMVRAWAAGVDDDGAGRALTDGTRWQAELWRRLRLRIGVLSPPERLTTACDRLRADPGSADLPDRLSLFGLTRLPAAHLDVLAAVAEHRHVHLFILHPSPVLWARIAGAQPMPRATSRAADTTARAVRHPLLASWGRDVREMQPVVTGGAPWHDHHRPVEGRTDTLLGRLQSDIREDPTPAGVPVTGHADGRMLLDPGDRTIQVHSCHGRARQVQVVRDAVLHLLDADPTLEPRDVIVMCPDIEAFAPLIHAIFGVTDPDSDGAADGGLPDLRVRLADRSIRHTNPVLATVAGVLELAGSRVTATEVLDLAGREPVRRRFHFDDDELQRLEEWVAASGVRWGLDADHRSAWQLAQVPGNTWRSGLDRTLLGVAAAESGRLWGGVLPLDDVEGADVDLVGRFAELLDRLHAAVTGLAPPRPLIRWAEALGAVADALTATGDADAWQRAELQRVLEDVVDESTGAGGASGAPLTLPELTMLLADRLRGRPTTANFRTGHLTVCTLVPMRSVPHRVVCLLGLDDGVFPRHSERDGDDLVIAEPRIGDHDARSEDRQLLLDALLAAEDHLIVTYSGRDERTNAERPPAVPIGELLDVIDRTARAGRGSARSQVVAHHPLQPFDTRNFARGALVPGIRWSFDGVELGGARALVLPREAAAPFLVAPLPPTDDPVLELADLEAFVRHPTRWFLRRRLGVSLSTRSQDVDDALPVELDGLEQWELGDRLLTARLAGAPLDRCREVETARGLLPPGGLAAPAFEAVLPTVEDVAAAALPLIAGLGDAASIEVAVPLGEGRRLVGRVAGVRGEVLLSVGYARVAPAHRLAAWVRLLAVSAAHPSEPFTAVLIGRARREARSATVTVVRIGPLGADAPSRRATAERYLAALTGLMAEGTCHPAPIFCRTSAARAVGADAAAEWESDFNRAGEADEPEHVLVLGGSVPFDTIAATPEFDRAARQLWDGPLSFEAIEDL